MRRRIAGAAAGLVLAAVTAFLGAPAASAACPNEAFRTGPSGALPECRAYEQVTPVDTESGVAIFRSGGAKVSASGDGVYFNSPSAYASSGGSFVANPYIATRTGGTWATEAIGGVQANLASVVFTGSIGVSDDLAHSVVFSKEALAPGAVPYGSNLYVRDNRTRTYATVAGLPGEIGFNLWGSISQPTPVLAGASSDWSTVLFASQEPLTSEPTSGISLYEFRGGETRLAVSDAQTATTIVDKNVVSADGSRFFYRKGEALYLHRIGQESLEIDEDKEGNTFAVTEAGFLGATPDDEVAFLTSDARSLYRFEASAPEGQRVTDLIPSNPSPTVTGGVVGEDGTTVYFSATSQLTPDAEPLPASGGYDLYVWHGDRGADGTIRYLGQSDGVFSSFEVGKVSPDGRFFAFSALGAVTPNAVDGPTCTAEGAPGCTDVFVYSYDENRMACASCAGSPANGSSQVGGERGQGIVLAADSMYDDGTVYFNTPNAIEPRDVNGVGDVYGWRGGDAHLISGGTDPAPSVFAAASTDRSDVFFRTNQGLVGQDVNSMVDLYDARVDGGLPQGGPVAEPSCITGDGCRSGEVPGSVAKTAASKALHGAGNARHECSAIQAKARTARDRSRALRRSAAQADGGRARSLRRKAMRATDRARRLGRRAGKCIGGGR